MSFLAMSIVGLLGWSTRNTLDTIHRRLDQKEAWIEELRHKSEKHSETLASTIAKDSADSERFRSVQDELGMVRAKLSEVEKVLVGMVSRLDTMMKTGNRRSSK